VKGYAEVLVSEKGGEKWEKERKVLGRVRGKNRTKKKRSFVGDKDTIGKKQGKGRKGAKKCGGAKRSLGRLSSSWGRSMRIEGMRGKE